MSNKPTDRTDQWLYDCEICKREVRGQSSCKPIKKLGGFVCDLDRKFIPYSRLKVKDDD